jgi:DNA-binding MarR family transcriptional regulator
VVEQQASAVGLTPAQHQLLVVIKGHPEPRPPSVREIADYLLLQSHSAVGLADRAEAAGVARRRPDPG